MEKLWSSEEKERVKQLGLDPRRNPPMKLMALAAYFERPEASIFGVTEGREETHVSKGLARKVRDLVEQGKLDWLRERDQRGRYQKVRSMRGSHNQLQDLLETELALLMENSGHWPGLRETAESL